MYIEFQLQTTMAACLPSQTGKLALLYNGHNDRKVRRLLTTLYFKFQEPVLPPLPCLKKRNYERVYTFRLQNLILEGVCLSCKCCGNKFQDLNCSIGISIPEIAGVLIHKLAIFSVSYVHCDSACQPAVSIYLPVELSGVHFICFSFMDFISFYYITVTCF